MNVGAPGWVYLLHFEHEIGSEDNPRGRAGHYLGHTGRDGLEARLAEHLAGRGARLTQVLLEQGVSWKLVRTWPGGRDLERALKDQKHANRLCPECQPNPQPGTTRKLPPPRAARTTPEHQDPPAAPQRKQVSQYDQGTRTADQVVGRLIAAGRTSAQIKAHHEYSTAPFYSGEIHHSAAAVERMDGYCQRYEELLAGVYEKEAAAAKETRKEGTHVVKFDREPKPASEYQKGVAAAHTLILRQVDAGKNADHIAAIHETAQTSFHGAERTPREWEFYNGYDSAAGQLVQDLRDVEAAKSARQPAREPVTATAPETDREMAS